MSQLWFRVSGSEKIVLQVHIAGSQNEKPAILQKMAECLDDSQRRDLRTLMQEFPVYSKTIEAIDILLRHYQIKNVNGLQWDSVTGHSICIECR
jgi:hypothetical protein